MCESRTRFLFPVQSSFQSRDASDVLESGLGLEDGHPGRGDGADVDVVRVRCSMERGFGCAAVDFGKRVLKQLHGGQNLQDTETVE